MKNSILFIASGIIIYGLFALCYGWTPMLWEEPTKVIFISIEILFPIAGYVFNGLTELTYDLRRLRDLENQAEEIITKAKKCRA